ncbi:unnamed protein product [Agarophyton chilense]|eukprot:gb/GEZJ01004555.1/.p2 GENE.gb/GEZJ01004555.1/~~gb/GEZJ01004555.1/.p2  ORF type:complete len:615 (-),score=98.39 gb/GEZJ01004555.1/:2344-4167(-)
MAQCAGTELRPVAPVVLKYDRQLRIWGDAGQTALRRASLCLVHASASGTETVKNLVLPAIGAVTIVDGAPLEPHLTAANFFLAKASDELSNRAHALVHSLHQLNHESATSFVPHRALTFIDSASAAYAFVLRFSVVVVADMPTTHPVVQYLSDACFRANVPFVLLRSYGMIGYLRIQTPMHCILNSRQDDLIPDLCVHAPFAQLQSLANATDLQSISDTTQLSHVPFVIILTKAVQIFRSRNNNQLPETTQQKQLFKQIVQSLRPAHCPQTAQNFEEALKPSNLRLCYAQTNAIPPNLQVVLSHPNSNAQTSEAFFVHPQQPQVHLFPEIVHFSKHQNKPFKCVQDDDKHAITTSTSENFAATIIAYQQARFWLVMAALRQFVQESGRLPVRGSLPDMTADTESYIAIQRIFSEKADKDAKRVFQFVQRIAEERATDLDIDETSVKSFCKNVHSIRVLSTKSLKEELNDWNLDAFKEAAMLEGGLDASTNGKASPYYAILRAVDRFHRQNGRYPGSDAVMKDNDLALMHGYVSQIKDELGLQSNSGLWRDETEEMVRYANAELHNVAAFMGGIAAQEITKIVTQQFVPLDNTLVVNMAEQSSTTFSA